MTTIKNRERILKKDVFKRVREFTNNPFLRKQLRFKPAKETYLESSEALQQLEHFLSPVYQAILQDQYFDSKWLSSRKSWS